MSASCIFHLCAYTVVVPLKVPIYRLIEMFRCSKTVVEGLVLHNGVITPEYEAELVEWLEQQMALGQAGKLVGDTFMYVVVVWWLVVVLCGVCVVFVWCRW